MHRRLGIRRALVFSVATFVWLAVAALPVWAAVPTISSFSPTAGAVGTSVVITGTGLTGTTTVSFNGTSATFTFNSDTQITASVPTGTTTGPIAVTNADGTATSSSNFTVTTTASTCSFDAGTATATVTLGAGSTIIAMSAGTLHVGAVDCTGATLTATDTIVVTGSSGDDEVALSLQDGPFAPGATDEGDGSSEIELTIDLGGGNDTFHVVGQSGRNRIVFGTRGVNLNQNEKADDADVSLANIEHFELTGGADKDILWAAGSYGTDKQFNASITIDGQAGNDIIGGGAAGDIVDGGSGWDDIRPLGGNDKVVGGNGYDLVYFQASNGVHADLGRGVARGQGRDRLSSIEQMWGAGGDDVLVGNGRGNWLAGLGGHDVVKGEGHADHLFGGSGPDLLRGGGGNDVLDGQPGTDTCYQDAGDGKFKSCEKKPEETTSGGTGGTSNCTPGYSPCLVYHNGADYDCSGGGGNGPYYTEPGVVYTVTGSDPYGLDADNDGKGCE